MVLELADSHCHIQSIGSSDGEAITRKLWAKGGDTDPDAVIQRAREAGITRLVCVGCDLDDSRLAVDFVKTRESCWASVGIHPHESKRYAGDPAAQRAFRELAAGAKVVAIGECGLDYFYTHSSKEDQVAWLRFQLELALERNLPMIFHVREAFGDFWPVFEEYQRGGQHIHGVMHSFTDSRANLDRALAHGLYIGVNGIATFTKKPEQQVVYQAIPSDKLLLETDAPFLTPVPYRGTICEPYHIRTIAEFLAKERGTTVTALAAATTRNTRHLFEI